MAFGSTSKSEKGGPARSEVSLRPRSLATILFSRSFKGIDFKSEKENGNDVRSINGFMFQDMKMKFYAAVRKPPFVFLTLLLLIGL